MIRASRMFVLVGLRGKHPSNLWSLLMPPDTQYAKSGDVHIAYQVFGDGPINLVMVPGFVSNIENYWDEPDSPVFCADWQPTLAW